MSLYCYRTTDEMAIARLPLLKWFGGSFGSLLMLVPLQNWAFNPPPKSLDGKNRCSVSLSSRLTPKTSQSVTEKKPQISQSAPAWEKERK